MRRGGEGGGEKEDVRILWEIRREQRSIVMTSFRRRLERRGPGRRKKTGSE